MLKMLPIAYASNINVNSQCNNDDDSENDELEGNIGNSTSMGS